MADRSVQGMSNQERAECMVQIHDLCRYIQTTRETLVEIDRELEKIDRKLQCSFDELSKEVWKKL